MYSALFLNRENSMKKIISRLMVMCFLAVSLAAFAQSDDNMKKDDSMKQN